MFKLYELKEMYQNIWDLVGDDEVDLDSLETALEQVEDGIETKAENIAKLIKKNLFALLLVCLEQGKP